MPGDPRVQELIEEILESGSSAEDVCRACPELLPEVREGWRRFRAIEAQVGALFPEPGSTVDHEATVPEIGPPRIPGYEILEVLGRGGVGVVYKAVHLRLNRAVALKMLLAGAFATRAERQRFSREAEVVARLRHPNIVQVYDVGDLDGRPYFTMEFVEGGSLAELIAGTPRPARQAAELMATLADAMAGGAPRGDRPPRPEAVQRPAHRRRHAQDRRLRPGPAPGGRAIADPERGRGGDAELHGPRAGPGQVGRGRAGGGPLRAGGGALRAAHGPAAVPGGIGGGDAAPGDHPGPRAAVATEREGAAGPGDDLPEVPAEGTAVAICRRRRAGGGPPPLPQG